MPAFDRRIKDFEAANTQVLGISTDSPFSHENWAKSVGISHYPLLSDIQRATVRDYGVYWADWNANSRATFVIDKQGVIRLKHIGPLTPDVIRERIEPILKQLNA